MIELDNKDLPQASYTDKVILLFFTDEKHINSPEREDTANPNDLTCIISPFSQSRIG